MESMDKIQQMAMQLGYGERPITNTLKLSAEGATVPFISRYRKEATGGLDEVAVERIVELGAALDVVAHRRAFILSALEAQGVLTPELQRRLTGCWDAEVLEDIYLPFKPKRRTRAAVARERGLAPLAERLLRQPQCDPQVAARDFLTKEVESVEAALQGARDVLAEQVSEDGRSRAEVRRVLERTAVMRVSVVKGKEQEAANYRDFFDWQGALKGCPAHRLLAIWRGEAAGLLRVAVAPADEERCMASLERAYVTPKSRTAEQVQLAVRDAYKRLLKPALVTELCSVRKAQADAAAIEVFATNLKQLLLAAPLGRKRVMGVDPGYRTGCKVVCLDAQGVLLHHGTIYPHAPQRQWAEAKQLLAHWIKQYDVEAVAIGNGTAGRETETLLQEMHPEGVDIFLVNEDGASVYSASATARAELPDYDVTVRGAVSIGRRLADPLAELVKIPPQALGVGQYQHDVDAKALQAALDRTVVACVNSVGVDLNTASKHLLTYVSGLGPALAEKIVAYRTEHGAFATRASLLKVPRLGAKAYEQCAGFLRIADGKNPLDNTGVHPERYALVQQLARDAQCDVPTLIASAEKRQQLNLAAYCKGDVGMPTLEDIMRELAKPGRDPRGKAQVFRYAEHLHSIADLAVGMEVPGVVTNLTDFGCFVDMGIKVKGLIHVSNLSDHFVKHPSDVVHLQQQVRVRVLDVDAERGRIGLKLVNA